MRRTWLIAAAVIILFVVGVCVLVASLPVTKQEIDEGTSLTVENKPSVCQMDAKICPDGSSVGREGPQCRFAECPGADATTTRVTTHLGGTATGLSVSLTPQEVLSDSRCPQGVACVWAGTVEVRTVLATPVGHGEHTLTLGKVQAFGDYMVTLAEVTPAKTEATIPNSSYRFTFTIENVR